MLAGAGQALLLMIDQPFSPYRLMEDPLSAEAFNLLCAGPTTYTPPTFSTRVFKPQASNKAGPPVNVDAAHVERVRTYNSFSPERLQI